MNQLALRSFLFAAALAASHAVEAGSRYRLPLIEPPEGFLSVSVVRVSNGVTVGSGQLAGTQRPRALLSPADTEGIVDLHPAGFEESFATGISGPFQAGVGANRTGGPASHALLWRGTADSVVDLHPQGFDLSYASGVSGNYQVGAAYSRVPGGGFTPHHAMLWNGTADSAVDLHPAGFTWSQASDVSGSLQVGWGFTASGAQHALLWNGTAESAVDLHPPGATGYSNLIATDGATHVGTLGPGTHAALWKGSVARAINLNPDGFVRSQAHGVLGDSQVGFAEEQNGTIHAMLWHGSAASAVDLHDLVVEQLGVATFSVAVAVDAFGNIYGNAGTAHSQFVAKWTLVPEPGHMALVGGAFAAVMFYRRLSGVLPARRFPATEPRAARRHAAAR